MEKSHEEKFGTPWVWRRTSLLLKDGTWEHETPGDKIWFYKEPYLSLRWEEQHPYFYLLPDGSFQSCMATIYIQEREWIHEQTGDRKISKSIRIEFDKELGPKTGSWKGGVIGCSYEMLGNETGLETLRRMEKERNFR